VKDISFRDVVEAVIWFLVVLAVIVGTALFVAETLFVTG